MPTTKLPSKSRVFVSTAVKAEGQTQDAVRALPVKFAFIEDAPPIEPDDVDYVVGSWAPTGLQARVTAGPGGTFVPTKGFTYHVWVWIDGATEEPRIYLGKLVSV